MVFFKAVAATLVLFLAMGGIMIGAAGTLHVPMIWLYLAVQLLLNLLVLGLLQLRNPDLIKERMRPGKGERDPWSIRIMMVLTTAHWALAGLDVGRYHWSDRIPLAVQIAGLLGVVGGFCFVTWAMLVNPFFSSAVRMQADRGQRLVSTGPYGMVRHPGYSGGLVFTLCSGLALGSGVSILPMLVTLALITRRTLLEEAMLAQDLPGYADYMERVRYRLVPGLW